MKKILFITQNFYPENFPINIFIKELPNFKKYVLTTFPSYPNIKYYKKFPRSFFFIKTVFRNITLYRVNSFPRKKDTCINFVFTYLSYLINGIIFVFFNFKRNQFDYIFVYATSPIIHALIAIFYKKCISRNSKIIVWVQDLWPESLFETGYIKKKFFLKIIDKLISYIYKNSDIILTQSKSLKKLIKSRSANLNIHYLPNLSNDFFIKKKIYKNSSFNILYAGNLGTMQNLELLLKVIERLKNHKFIKFKIVGSGSLKSYITEYKVKKNLYNLEILNHKKYSELKNIYRNSDLLFVSLKKGFLSRIIIPSKIQSYMSTGVPILSCINGESNNLIKTSDSGFSCNQLNENKIASLILKISQLSKIELQKKGKNGRKYFLKNFSNHKIFQKFNFLIKKYL